MYSFCGCEYLDRMAGRESLWSFPESSWEPPKHTTSRGIAALNRDLCDCSLNFASYYVVRVNKNVKIEK